MRPRLSDSIDRSDEAESWFNAIAPTNDSTSRKRTNAILRILVVSSGGGRGHLPIDRIASGGSAHPAQALVLDRVEGARAGRAGLKAIADLPVLTSRVLFEPWRSD